MADELKTQLQKFFEVMGAKELYEITGQPNRLIAAFETRDERELAGDELLADFSLEAQYGSLAKNALSEDPRLYKVYFTLDIYLL